jgi:hypothetical protein
MIVEIVFDSNYAYDSDFFAMTLSDELKSGGYTVKTLRYAKTGEAGKITVDGQQVDASHPVNALIKKVENKSDNLGTAVVF